MAGSHKLLRIFAEVRLNGKVIPSDSRPLDVIRWAEQDDNIHRIRKDTYMCAYKTVYKDKNSLILFVTTKLPGSITGSSLASESVMGIVTLLEKILSPISYIHYDRDIEKNKRNIANVTIIKEIEED